MDLMLSVGSNRADTQKEIAWTGCHPDMKVVKNNSPFSTSLVLSETRSWPFSHAYVISCICSHWPVVFDHELKWLYMLRLSASGLQKMYVHTYSSQIFKCVPFCPWQGRGVGCDLTLLKLGKQTWHYSSCRKLQLARNCLLWWNFGKVALFYVRFFHICNINIEVLIILNMLY